MTVLPLVAAGAVALGSPRRATAAAGLAAAYGKVAQSYPDAELLSVAGAADAEGAAVCEAADANTNGWRYEFRSLSKRAFLLVIDCRGTLVGPLTEIVEAARDERKWPIKGTFIDSDRTLRILKDYGVSLDPYDHDAGGKRPFSMSLARLEQEGSKLPPVFWRVKVGRDSYTIDADTQKVLGMTPKAPAAAASGASSSSAAGATAGTQAAVSPKGRSKSGTAKSGWGDVRLYAQKRMPGAFLMGVDAIVDAAGRAPCAGPGDGWMYYFYWPRSGAIEPVYDCNGDVGSGQGAYVPVDPVMHKPIQGDFVDSDRAMGGLVTAVQGAMSEGLGRRNTRTAPMRLLNHKTPPVPEGDLFKITQVWEIEIGLRLFYVDAKTGNFIGERGRQ